MYCENENVNIPHFVSLLNLSRQNIYANLEMEDENDG